MIYKLILLVNQFCWMTSEKKSDRRLANHAQPSKMMEARPEMLATQQPTPPRIWAIIQQPPLPVAQTPLTSKIGMNLPWTKTTILM